MIELIDFGKDYGDFRAVECLNLKIGAGEMFGFFGVFDRFGGALGSLLFGLMLTLTGSSRPAILSLIVLFIGGALILTAVDVERGRRVADEENRRTRLRAGEPGAS